MAVKCPKCHSENTDTARFCSNCAAPLASSRETEVTKTMTVQKRPKFESKGALLAGKYRILEPIGKGGMGVIYKAEDIKLERMVALKFLPTEVTGEPEARERFVREAKAAAALSHPQICTVYEIGEEENQYFIAMEYIGGRSLKEKIQKKALDQAEALDIAVQVAQGLEEAHKKGIIHRDIKPGNIMLTDKGTAKVMDFGLAKVFGSSLITKEAKTMGTVAYMSPEQAQGQSIDHRTDIWSLGVVLYEMLTGQLPFRGEFEQSMIHSILSHEPEPLSKLCPSLPKEAQDVVLTALAKDPASRYRSMKEFLDDLKALAEGLKPLRAKPGLLRGKLFGIKKTYALAGFGCLIAIIGMAMVFLFPKGGQAYDSIAVLPIENISGDPTQDAFCYGVYQDLVTYLSSIKAFKKVIDKNTMMTFKGTKKKSSEIAGELKVSTIITASAESSGSRVSIRYEVIDGPNDRQIGGGKFDGEFRDILSLEGQAALAIAQKIQVDLTPGESQTLLHKRTVNPEAHQLYLKGLYQYKKWTKEGMKKAIEYLQEAIKVDPTHAQALATLADCYGWLGFLGYLRPEEDNPERVNSLVTRALEIDETLPEAHRLLAMLKWSAAEWVDAEREYMRTIELNPNYSAAHYSYAWYLSSQGHFEKAIAEAKRAQELDPLSIPPKMAAGEVYYWARRYVQAIAQFQQITDLEPTHERAYGFLARAYEQMGKYEDAVRARQKEMALAGSLPEEVGALARAYAQQGPKGYWMWRLQKLEGRSAPSLAYTAAECYAHLGNKEEAIASLERAYQEGDSWMLYLKVQAEWDMLHDDPRFKKLLRLMKYPEN